MTPEIDLEKGNYKSEDYFDAEGNKRKRYFTHKGWAYRQARQQLKKKTAPHTKPYVYRLGYNHCIGQYCSQENYPNLSGSSLNRSLNDKKKKAKLFIQLPDKESNQDPHVFSKRSRGKVKDKATAFFRSINARDRFFVTLTFIHHVSDQDGVSILNKFLTVLRKEKPGLLYLWVAEHQEENPAKTIHFHIIINRRLSIRRFNALWILQQYNAGLRHKDSEGNELSMSEIIRRYDYDMTAKFKKKDPDSLQAILNPFHIDKCKTISGLSFYLTKYITKQQANDEFGCLNWHCSRKVSKLFTREIVGPSTFAYMCSFANMVVDFNTGEVISEPKPFKKQWFSMVYVNNKASPLSRLKQLEQVNKWIIDDFEPDKLSQLDDLLYKKIFLKCTI